MAHSALHRDLDLPTERLPRTPAVRIDMDDPGDAEEDEEAMRRANQDVVMMQRQMIDRTSPSSAAPTEPRP
jgi:hypothetical protein